MLRAEIEQAREEAKAREEEVRFAAFDNSRKILRELPSPRHREEALRPTKKYRNRVEGSVVAPSSDGDIRGK